MHVGTWRVAGEASRTVRYRVNPLGSAHSYYYGSERVRKGSKGKQNTFAAPVRR
jgi:hypothetical protein